MTAIGMAARGGATGEPVEAPLIVGEGPRVRIPFPPSRESANFRFLRRRALTCLSAAQHYRADAHHGSFPLSGSQIVYCSPMTHGPFSSLRSISSKHSVMVAHTLTLHRLDRRGDALCRHAAPRFAGHRRFFRDAEKMGLDQNPRKTTLSLS